MRITKSYLKNNPDHVFVFGDNLLRKGKGGAAVLRDEPNTYGIITKKYPNNKDISFYRPEEYDEIFNLELRKLKWFIDENPDKLFLVSKIGAGLANKYNIFEKIILPSLKEMNNYKNVKFLF